MSKNVWITVLCCAVVGLGVYTFTNRSGNNTGKTVSDQAPGNTPVNKIAEVKENPAVRNDNPGQPEIKKEVPKDVPPTKSKANSTELFYQFFEKYMLAIRGKVSLEKDAESLDDTGKAKLVEWFNKVDLGEMSTEQKVDCERCRVAIIGYLKDPIKSSFALGTFLAKMTKMMFPVLVDFELNGAKAKSDGHPALAEVIDAHLSMTKTILLLECKIDPKKTEGSQAVKLFGEFFVIYVYIGAVEERYQATPGQAALLAMHPEDLTNPQERELLGDVHKSLLMLSNALNAGEDTARAQGRVMVTIITTMKKLKITPEDLGKATDKSYVEIAEKMLKLVE